MDVIDWLLEGDPSIRWQVLRDLLDAPAEQVAAERARVETEGWGARILGMRDVDGQWDGGACFPRRIADDWRAGIQPDFSHGQPWTSTLPTLMLLRDLGLEPESPAAPRTTRSPAVTSSAMIVPFIGARIVPLATPPSAEGRAKL